MPERDKPFKARREIDEESTSHTAAQHTKRHTHDEDLPERAKDEHDDLNEDSGDTTSQEQE